MAIKDLTKVDIHLFLCSGGTCKNKGAEDSTVAIRNAINAQGLGESVHTTKTLCNGRCHDGPIVICQPEGIWLKQMTADKADEFVQNYLLNGTIPERQRLYKYGESTILTDEEVAAP